MNQRFVTLKIFALSSLFILINSAYAAKAPDSSDLDALDMEPAAQDTVLLKQGYFSIDSKADGDVNIKVTDEQCQKDTYPALYYAIRDSHLNEDGFTMGLFNEVELDEDGSGYAIKGTTYEIDDSSGRPHDWIGVNWQIWCSSNKDVIGSDEILTPREHDP